MFTNIHTQNTKLKTTTYKQKISNVKTSKQKTQNNNKKHPDKAL